MKFTAFIILAFCLQVSAATLAQTVTLSEHKAPLEKVINEIKHQTGYSFFYNQDWLQQAQPVDVEAKNAPLEQVLKSCFANQPFDYAIVNKTIVLKLKEKPAEKKETAVPSVTVTGKVTDELGNPLPGVTVKQKDKPTNATATDNKGNYTLTVPDDKTIIAFSFIGYETVELATKDINSGSVITLKATETNLKEVVVDKGYYREKQELLTGDVSIVTAKTIGEQPVSDPIMALEGQVPGLQISQTSGMPGANFSILLRGQNSIANGVSPLYIVDGVPFISYSLTSPGIGGGAVGYPSSAPSAPSPFQGGGLSPFNNLNPSDIESIEVLKDADATAIYGSRGANGVILITTKKGKPGQTRVDVDINSGVGNVTRTVPLLNTQQYLQMRHEGFKNDGILPGPNDYDVNGTWDTTRYTNWQKVLIGGTAHFTRSNASISGGNANTQFNLGGGYSDQTTVFPGNYHDQKASAHINLTHQSTNNKFHTQFSAQYVQDNNLLPDVDFTQYIALAPDAPALRDANGNINFGNGIFNNPLIPGLSTNSAITTNLLSNLNVGYDILQGLRLQGNFGYTHMQMNQSQTFPGSEVYGPVVNNNRFLNIATSNTNTWIIEPQLSYNRSISKGKLDVLIGSSIQRNQYNTQGLEGVGFSDDALIANIANAAAIYSEGSNMTDYRYNALYGRVNYDWQDKYIVNATVRRDGSSRFGPGNQFGNFGAVGAAWLFSKEKFIEDGLSFLSSGKLRASYGTSGNDQITDYQYLSTYGASGNYQGTAGLVPNRIASPYYAWEVVKKLEGGLELGFVQDRINLSVSVYRNRTGNQLVGQPLPSQDGFTLIQANLPAVVQNAGEEIALNTINFRSKDFSWSTNLNFTSYRNKLVSFPGLANNSAYFNKLFIGRPIFTQKETHYTGVDPQTGLYTFQDVDNNGVLGLPDNQPLKYVAPDYFGGLSNSFSYKGWQLDVFLQFVKQTGYSFIRSSSLPGSFGGLNDNQPIWVLNRWQKPGDITNIQQFTTGIGNASTAFYATQSSDYGIVDASFLRLKNVALSYTLPIKWQQAMHLQNLRIYFQAQNLLTITGYQGLDPETQGLSTLPPLRMISLGIHASL